ncbi:MAG: DUF4388 domain-containing protein [Chloroflexota bacterium]|nr:DUF4388 domain-containing protein [Chloroflexota bacterium]
MALKGNLRDFTINQLLNLVSVAQKTGTLEIKGPTQSAQIAFREGKLASAHTDQNDSSLAAILYRRGQLTKRQLQLIKARAGNIGDKELGLLLINANYLTQKEILTSLKEEFIEVVNNLFTWVEGFFQFYNDAMPESGKITLRINLENIIMEGSRRLREWEQLQDEIPSLDIALKFTDNPSTDLRNVNLSVEEWRVVSYINPKNTIHQISKATKMNDLEIRRIIYGLLQAGLVEMIRAEGIKKPKYQKPSLPVSGQKEQKSLVNRLIKRIQSL